MAMVGTGVGLYVVPSDALAVLQAATLPLSLFSKLPQIRQNARSGSTGQLSAFAVIAQILGCLARLFTTGMEVGDVLVSAGFALALVLNVVLGVELWAYWGKEGVEDGKGKIEMPEYGQYAEKGKDEAPAWQGQGSDKVEVVVPPSTPRQSQSGSGRRWARKVD